MNPEIIHPEHAEDDICARDGGMQGVGAKRMVWHNRRHVGGGWFEYGHIAEIGEAMHFRREVGIGPHSVSVSSDVIQ
ncbi:MAG: hypothetical protein VX815_18265 [Gemmatimonadota bacterium]|nr:hypothetical protein [Gemmatimonadota bacterium]